MFVKTSSAKVVGFSQKANARTAGKRSVGSFEYEPNTDGNYLYVAARACTADVPNLNYDMLPHDELKTAYESFIGCPVFLNHDNQDTAKARGVIIDAKYHQDDDDKWIEILCEMDEDRCPKLCSLIRNGEIDTMSMGCFVPGTKITLADGTSKNIEDIVEGDNVLTHAGNIKRVSYTMTHEHDGVIYEISSYAQPTPMRLTEEHPVWIRRPQRDARDRVRERVDKNRGELTHMCVCGREFATHGSLSAHIRESKRWGHDGEHDYAPSFEGWVDAKDVEIGDYVLSPKSNRSSDGDITIARLLGYYLAEGNLCYDKKRALPDNVPCGVEWTFSESEIDYHMEVMGLIGELGYKPVGPYFKNGAATIRCNSPELAAKMFELGGKYSWGKRIDRSIMEWDVEIQRGLLEAYFNGDAHWELTPNGRHFEFSTVSKDLAEQIYLLCVRCGIRCSEPKMRMSAQVEAGEKRPFYSAQGMFDGVADGSKHLAYADNKGIWRRVTKIRMLEYSGNVYNFEVEDDHSYVAEGCAVHNCTVDTTTCSICGNVAEYPYEYCDHIQQKGREYQGKLAFEICNGIDFFEESFVYEPADPTAHVQGMDKNAKKKHARRMVSQWIDLVDRLEIAKALERNTVVEVNPHGGKPKFDDDEQWAFPYMNVDYKIRGYYDGNGVDASYEIKASVLIEEGKGFHQNGYESVSATLWFVDDKIEMPDVAEMIGNILNSGVGGYNYWTNVGEIGFLFSDGIYGWPEGEDAWLMRIADYIADRIDYEAAMGITAQNYSDAPRTPEDVDSKGVDEVCPLCGSDSYDGEECSTCGYAGSPEGFDDIALDFEVEEEDEEEDSFDEAEDDEPVDDESEDADVDDESDDEDNDEEDESDEEEDEEDEDEDDDEEDDELAFA